MSKIKKAINYDDLDLLALSSLLIASKYEDVLPLTLERIVNEIGAKKYQKSEILALERQILSQLDYKMPDKFFYEESCIKIREILRCKNSLRIV